MYWGIIEGLMSALAVAKQAGNFAMAYFTVIIGVHTFNTLVLKKPQSAWLCGGVLIVGWLSSLAMGTRSIPASSL